MSSTTKVITDFDEFKNETDREEFRYVVPDFRFNKRFDRLSTLSEGQKKKTEFLCNECCNFGCSDRKNAMRVSAANPLGRQVQSITAHHLMQKMDIFFKSDVKSGIYRCRGH